ncbi:hypothetical protein RF11_03813 [Thelohanellus kitauei]|uniref:Uncharacterized protein n=1 Tax=Thelohanellus kitauei TaxID=669202 RepID=A0A0C2MXJ6_THEKT|nr:hypothetical protein RF11_03813 [Thelohanellus kitauei]
MSLFSVRQNLIPNRILIHFEEAASMVFHFMQSIWLKINEYHDIRTQYQTNENFELYIIMLTALAFLSPARVRKAFEAVQNPFFVSNYDLLPPLMSYFAKIIVES